VRALRAHGIRRLVVRRQAGVRDIAHVAGLLAREAGGPDASAALARELDTLRLWGVRLVPDDAAREPGSLPDAVEEALTALARGTDAERDARVRTFMGAITAAAADDPAQRARIVAGSLARVLAGADDAMRDALLAHASAPVLIALADAVVSTDDATRQDGLAVFHEAGAVGPQGLVALLASAETIRQRRRCFDALLAIGDGVPALIEALGHTQWYVVRNAAQLLGELRAREAVAGLGRVLLHTDARVREAVAASLEEIGTAAARTALRAAVDDPAPEVRRIAARAFGAADASSSGGDGPPAARQTARLIEAFDRETDAEALLEQVRALGHAATPDAVQCLLRATGLTPGPAQPTEVRLCALEALVRARGGAVLPTLRALRQDRDPAVRDLGRHLERTLRSGTSRAARRTTSPRSAAT
jgi:HEAT repeat protein